MTISELVVATVLSISPVSEANASDDLWLDSQIECMAQNVYHEARSQGTAGRLAVIAVTSNRVQDSRYPNTICEVVKQGPHRPSWKGTGELIPVRHRCQFSWYCDGKPDIVRDFDIYEEIIELSIDVWEDRYEDNTEGSLFYHADYVEPTWAQHMAKTVKIDRHIFYTASY